MHPRRHPIDIADGVLIDYPKKADTGPCTECGLIDVYVWGTAHDREIAVNFIADLVGKLASIADVKFTGAPRDPIYKGWPVVPDRDRSIYYRSTKEQIIVSRRPHGAPHVAGQKSICKHACQPA